MIRNRWVRLLWIGIALLLAVPAAPTSPTQTAYAQSAQLRLEPVANGLGPLVYLTHAGDGSGRRFIVAQAGQIYVLAPGATKPTLFINISDKVRSPESGGGGEEGLLSLAFPPNFKEKGYFYVYYTRPTGDNVVSRFYVQSANPELGDPNREEVFLPLPHPTYANHNGGQLAFGPDGYLYIATGDGGGGGDPQENAQNPNALLGKLLRIDTEREPLPEPVGDEHVFLPFVLGVERPAPAEKIYRIPPDNPFVNRPGYRAEIWALGLRNPWRFSFDRQTGDLWIGDVGQGVMEEIDFQAAGQPGGQNYGWDNLEGTRCYEPSTGCTEPENYVPPVFVYEHGPDEVNGCSVTGGFVSRSAALPAQQGVYLYSDFCSGKIWGLSPQGAGWENALLLDTELNITGFGEDQDGRLYVVTVGGEVFQLAQPTE